jgi:hypothetical protein
MAIRFTIDGSESLERHLGCVCDRVADTVNVITGASKLDALLLGGGYGRGQGGVLRSAAAEAPYNDLEFYVFIKGNRLINERRYSAPLRRAGDRLSQYAGVHVEFKVDSLERLRSSDVSMFTYDLIAGHRLLFGTEEKLEGCEHHLDATRIPLLEATRLLFNRCTGLLLASEILIQPSLTSEQADFVGRNIAKAQLAAGDAVLTAFGEYHWSCLERTLRLQQLQMDESLPWLEETRAQHAAGVEFKLHPVRTPYDRERLKQQHQAVSGLMRKIWLWLETRRLSATFASERDYSLRPFVPGTNRSWRNMLLTLRSFGLRAVARPLSGFYPRERLFKVLPLLLWNENSLADPAIARHVQVQLETNALKWVDLVAVYKQVWPGYG